MKKIALIIFVLFLIISGLVIFSSQQKNQPRNDLLNEPMISGETSLNDNLILNTDINSFPQVVPTFLAYSLNMQESILNEKQDTIHFTSENTSFYQGGFNYQKNSNENNINNIVGALKSYSIETIEGELDFISSVDAFREIQNLTNSLGIEIESSPQSFYCLSKDNLEKSEKEIQQVDPSFIIPDELLTSLRPIYYFKTSIRINDLPIYTNDHGTMDNYQYGYGSYIEVIYDEAGITMMNIINLFEGTSGQIEKIISSNDAINVIKEKYDHLFVTGYDSITKLTLEYMPFYHGTSVFYEPVYIFYMENSKGQKLPDLYVHAFTGNEVI